MLKQTFIIWILVTSVTSETLSRVKVTPSFRRLGYLATGLSYGHIHGQIDFKALWHAQQQVMHVIDNRLKTSKTNEEMLFIEALRPQLNIATKTIEDLQALFFGQPRHRQKRQLFVGIGMALGLISMGTSIYSATEVTKLHHELTNLQTDFQHVAHKLEEEAHTINKLTKNLETVKATCQIVLGKVDVEMKHISALTNVLGLITMVNTLCAELNAWGRGLELLTNGKLHPALVEHRRLRQAISHIEEKARLAGRRLLHDNGNGIFKAPVSYLATEDGKIIFIVHIALVDQSPMELFEYLSTPVSAKNLYLEITANKKVFATDDRGQAGIEMTQEDLLRCKTEERHNGKTFICTNANLIRNDIRKTCMGAIFFGHEDEIELRCDHTLAREINEDVRQIATNEILIFSKENSTIIEKCKNGTTYQTVMKGLVRKATKPGCEITTREFSFKSQVDIETEENFIRREVETTKFGFLESRTDEKIQRAVEALKQLKEPERIRTDDIEEWINNESNDDWTSGAHLVMSATAGIISFLAVITILYLFVQYRRSRVHNDQK